MERKMAEFEEIKYKINLRDIKSSYIINKIFLFLCEEQKLKMIVNNKEFQKICLVGIEDFKKESGKYKIGDKNGKGKEYIINKNILYMNQNKMEKNIINFKN